MSIPIHLPLRQYLRRLDLPIDIKPPEVERILIPAVAADLDLGLSTLEKWRSSVAKVQTAAARKDRLPDFVRDLGICVSPFIELKQHQSSSRGLSLAARRPFPAGVFLASVPVSSILSQQPQEQDEQQQQQQQQVTDGRDGVSVFLNGVDQLSVQLLTALIAEQSQNKFSSYAKYLHEHVTPPKNLPFIVPGLRQSREGSTACYEPKSALARALVSQFERRVVEYSKSPPQQEEEESLAGVAACPALYGVPSHHLRWAASMVLSRRVGGTMLAPFVDFMNHSHRNSNAFYTMAPSVGAMSGLDLVDNTFAGVSAERLLEPHLHVFSIQPVEHRGEEITLSYMDVDPRWKLQTKDEDHRKNEEGGGDAAPDRTEAELTDCGEDIWQLLYGFVPPRVTDSPLRALQQVAEVVTRRRLAGRRDLFPRKREGKKNADQQPVAAEDAPPEFD